MAARTAVSTASIFGGGVPTEPDVKRLNDAFGVPTEGTLIEYGAVEKVLQLSRKTYRYNTVTRQWRARLEREHAVFLMAEDNVGYKAANPSERVDVASKQVKTGVRAIRHAGRIANKTDVRRLSPEERKTNDHISMLHGFQLVYEKTQPLALPG